MGQEDQYLLELLVRSSIDGIVGFDQQCRFTVWNPGMETISGFSEADCLGKKAFEVFPFLVEIGEDKYFYEALRGNVVASRDRPYHIPSTGRRGWFEGYYSPIRDREENILGGLAIVRDITDRRILETEWHRVMSAFQDRQRRMSELARRERKVFELLCNGADRPQIAESLGISVRSVSRIKTAIEAKLGLEEHNLFSFFRDCASGATD